MAKRTLEPGTFAVVPLLSVKGMDPYAQTVYAWLFQHANQTSVCWPSIRQLMECCGIKSRSKVKECLRMLESAGLVKHTERPDTSSIYEVFFDDTPGRNTATPPAAIRPTPGRNTATELEPLELEPINAESQGTIVPTAQAPGDPGISALIFEIKCHCEKHGWAYDRKDDRRMARHILTAKDFKAQADSVGMSQHSYAVAIVMASALLDFWRGKVCGPAAIYRHHAKVYNEAKELKNRNATPHFKTL